MSGGFPLVDETMRATFGGEPVWRFFVPGRLEVVGKHTDYAGGRTLVAAVPRGFAVAARPAADGYVRVVDAVSRQRFDCPVAPVAAGALRWHRYVTTVVGRLRTNFPEAELSAEIVLASDLPAAAGISSSSALVIGIAEALIARSSLEATPRWRDAIGGTAARASYFGCIENGSAFGALSGDGGVGTHGGSEDHAAILLSRAGHLQLFAFAPLRAERTVAMPSGWTFVVASSGVRASKTGEARERYNRLSAEAAEIARLWRTEHPGDARSLGELARAGALSSLHVPPSLDARLAHFVAEDARAAAAADAFARGHIEEVGELSAASQRDAERLLGNQTRETTELVAIARRLGAAAACAFGAGWGGSVWALVQAGQGDAFLREWLRTYESRYPSHGATGFVSPPGDGVRAVTRG